MKEQNEEKRLKREMSECTFKPVTNKNTPRLIKHSYSKSNLAMTSTGFLEL